jgi:hypothetical protein
LSELLGRGGTRITLALSNLIAGCIVTGATLLTNVRWGIAYGLGFASMFVLYVLGLFAVRGAQPFERLGTTLTGCIALYLAGGIMTGTLVGLLRPLLVTRRGAMVVGAVATVPTAAGAMVLVAGPITRWDKGAWVVPVGYSVLIGPVVAANWWRAKHPTSSNEKG